MTIRLGRATETLTTHKNSMAVDTHAHIFERGIKIAAVHRYVPTYDATLAQYLSELDAHGLTHGVLVQPSFLGTDNSYLLSALRKVPNRLRGVIVVDPNANLPDLLELKKIGVIGIRLNLIGVPIPDFHKKPWPEFLTRLSELGWFVQVHREARDLPYVISPLIDNGLNVVVDHFGRPSPQLSTRDPGFTYLLKVAESRKVWVKLSGAYRNGPNGLGEKIARESVPLLKTAFGIDRLIWGSDWPHTQFENVANYTAARNDLNEWITDPSERAAVLWTTPAKLCNFV